MIVNTTILRVSMNLTDRLRASVFFSIALKLGPKSIGCKVFRAGLLIHRLLTNKRLVVLSTPPLYIPARCSIQYLIWRLVNTGLKQSFVVDNDLHYYL